LIYTFIGDIHSSVIGVARPGECIGYVYRSFGLLNEIPQPMPPHSEPVHWRRPKTSQLLDLDRYGFFLNSTIADPIFLISSSQSSSRYFWALGNMISVYVIPLRSPSTVALFCSIALHYLEDNDGRTGAVNLLHEDDG
jgi:hypothetical protein